MRERMASRLFLALAALQPLAGRLAQLTGYGVSIERRSEAAHGALTPANGAFAIWGPLFVANIALALRSFGSDAAREPAHRRIMRLNELAFAGNSAWSLQAQFRGLGWPSVAIIFGSATAAIAATIEAQSLAARSAFARFAALTTAPLAGWLTVASFANLDAALAAARASPKHESRHAAALGAAAGAATSVIALATHGNLGYAAAAGWGLSGIALRNHREWRPAVVRTAAIGLAALAAATWVARRYLRA
jgi:hypothetical protein